MSTSRYNNNLPISFSRLIFFFFKSFSRLSLKSRLTSRLISYRGGVAERDLGGGGGGGVSGVGCGKMNLVGEGVLQPFSVCWEEFGVGDGVTISDKKLVLSIYVDLLVWSLGVGLVIIEKHILLVYFIFQVIWKGL